MKIFFNILRSRLGTSFVYCVDHSTLLSSLCVRYYKDPSQASTKFSLSVAK